MPSTKPSFSFCDWCNVNFSELMQNSQSGKAGRQAGRKRKNKGRKEGKEKGQREEGKEMGGRKGGRENRPCEKGNNVTS